MTSFDNYTSNKLRGTSYSYSSSINFEGFNQEDVDFAGGIGGGLSTLWGASAHYSGLVKVAGRIGVVGNVISGSAYGHAFLTNQLKPSHHLDIAITGAILTLSVFPATAPFAIPVGFVYGGVRLIGGEAFDNWFNSQFSKPTPVLIPKKVKP